jgi:hypothetical protein
VRVDLYDLTEGGQCGGTGVHPETARALARSRVDLSAQSLP